MTQPHPQQEYIITDKMIKAWRNGCAKGIQITFDDSRCLDCEFCGTGARYHCCDFDDVDVEKMFRSHPHTPAAPATEPKPLRYSGVTVFTPPELSRHDAATRKAEREKMLEEICEPATDENKKDGWKLNVKWLVDIHRNIRNEGDNLCLEDIESVLLALKESLRGGGAP